MNETATDEKPNRRGEIKLILVALLIMAVPSAVFLYYYVTGTPAYSLYLLRNAVRDGDRATFYHHFDTGRVAEAFVADKFANAPPAVPRKAVAGFVERVLKQKVEEKLAGGERAELAGMELESMDRRGRTASVVVASPSKRITFELEQMDDRRWKVVALDLERAGIPVEMPDPRSLRPASP